MVRSTRMAALLHVDVSHAAMLTPHWEGSLLKGGLLFRLLLQRVFFKAVRMGKYMAGL